MTTRGGYLALRIAAILTADGWTDLSGSALGAWVRIKATNELTESGASARACERLGVTAADIAELEAAGLLEETRGLYEAVGMPGIKAPKPSDSPEAVAKRMREYRARQKAARENESPPPPPKEEVQPSVVKVTPVTPGLRVTTADAPRSTLNRPDDEARPTDPMEEGDEAAVRMGTTPSNGYAPVTRNDGGDPDDQPEPVKPASTAEQTDAPSACQYPGEHRMTGAHRDGSCVLCAPPLGQVAS
jgi:hypothetical protein